ncbi:PIN-like domain-containing protein [Exiguobacterium sp. s183]|uniref:PIN-like domain-containing protein n=1 Tax=Exiguobacterium sp. s183 TaxID=2751262 RepID=UPI001BE5CC40
MAEAFREFFHNTHLDFKNLDSDTLVVFDTNTLLNIYRYSNDTREKLVNTIKSIKENVWIPYQVGLEFNLQRRSVQQQIKDKLESKESEIDSYFSSLEKEINSNLLVIPLKSSDIQNSKKEILDFVASELSTLKTKTNEKIKELFGMIDLEKDLIEEFEEIFKDRIGECYTPEVLSTKLSDAESRFEKLIPPGFEDRKKKDTIYYNGLEIPEKFGDLILWYQILDRAKDEAINKVVFITDDQKDDWWYRLKGKTIGPRAELKNELLRISNADLFMYSSNSFLNQFSDTGIKDLISESVKDTSTSFKKITFVTPSKFQETDGDSDTGLKLKDNRQYKYENFLFKLALENIQKQLDSLENDGKDPYSTEYIDLLIKKAEIENKIELNKKLLDISNKEH